MSVLVGLSLVWLIVVLVPVFVCALHAGSWRRPFPQSGVFVLPRDPRLDTFGDREAATVRVLAVVVCLSAGQFFDSGLWMYGVNTSLCSTVANQFFVTFTSRVAFGHYLMRHISTLCNLAAHVVVATEVHKHFVG